MNLTLSRIWAWLATQGRQWSLWLIASVGAVLVALLAILAPHAPPTPPGPVPPPEPVYPYTPGWIPDPAAVKAVLQDLKRDQGFAEWGEVFRDDEGPFGDPDSPVFFWEAESRVLGKVLGSWDQKNVGSCVSFGWGRGCQDLMLVQIALGQDDWPGAEVATEPIYGGSRVEVGGGRIGGDGSVGAWAAKYVADWGLLLRQKYLDGKYDLSTYDVQRCRQYGSKGVPDDLEPIAKEHPVKGFALVKSAADAWQAIGSGYPIPVCSNVGYQSPLKEGYCSRSGSWAHCMTFRGRFVHPSRGKSFVIQNSWGNYLSSGDPLIEVKGRAEKVRLPEGCFAITEKDADNMLRQGDSFAVSAFKGFPKRKLDWLINHNGGIEYAHSRVRPARSAVRHDGLLLSLRPMQGR